MWMCWHYDIGCVIEGFVCIVYVDVCWRYDIWCVIQGFVCIVYVDVCWHYDIWCVIEENIVSSIPGALRTVVELYS